MLSMLIRRLLIPSDRLRRLGEHGPTVVALRLHAGAQHRAAALQHVPMRTFAELELQGLDTGGNRIRRADRHLLAIQAKDGDRGPVHSEGSHK